MRKFVFLLLCCTLVSCEAKHEAHYTHPCIDRIEERKALRTAYSLTVVKEIRKDSIVYIESDSAFIDDIFYLTQSKCWELEEPKEYNKTKYKFKCTCAEEMGDES